MRDNVITARRNRAGRDTATFAMAMLLISAAPRITVAQAGPTHVQDATPVPRGMVRFSVIPSWQRYDSRFTGSGSSTEPLGAVLTSDALGTAELPALGPYEAALRTLTGNQNLRLSLGQSRAASSVRVVTTPVSLEYGLTNRLSVGVTLPIVQRQRELVLEIETEGEAASNVGPVGSAAVAGIRNRAAALSQSITNAALALSQRIAQCSAQPSGNGCAAVNADPAGAQATVAEAAQVAASVVYVYGTSAEQPGAIGLVPRAALTAGIEERLRTLNDRFATYLGAAPIANVQVPGAAQGAVAAGDVRSLAQLNGVGIGPDSLARVAKIGLGDVEIGARFLAWDNAARRAPADSLQRTGARMRLMLGALARLGTGLPPNDDELFVVSGGDGQTDVEASVAFDVDGIGQFGATLLGRYAAQFGDVEATRVPDAQGNLTPFGARSVGRRSPGDILALELSPRYRLGNSVYISGHYSFLSRGEDSYTFPLAATVDPLPGAPTMPVTASAGGYTEQRAGIGATYSTYGDWLRGRVRVPIEVSYTHLETFSGSSALVPRAGRDQIAVRLYFPLRR